MLRARSIFAACLLSAALFGCARSGGEPPGPYNVVLITLDTVRADHLAAYGYERRTMPALERFMEPGRTLRERRRGHDLHDTFARHHADGAPSPRARCGDDGWVLPAGQPDAGRGAPGARVPDGRLRRRTLGARRAIRVRPGLRGLRRGHDGPAARRRRDRRGSRIHRRGRGRALLRWIQLLRRPLRIRPPASLRRNLHRGNRLRLRPSRKCGKHYYNKREMSEAEIARMRALYDGELLYLDGQLQRLFERFEALGVLERDDLPGHGRPWRGPSRAGA